ncbi:RNA polymerase sigma factor [Microbacterium galbinum]|uniref:Sigma-70 family RNA polymerase sigma factor n=1 Tax=Microbacterium galbinum TaxID=2851646 RepID=A0ABY4IRC2_9MICO|nr:sigma-70 family RNA polymerase sigma factor [Microbacterium galbinum]UPL14195.1 sigma-70 family RNA polymerase sigma factor [Microbacterium galbinum]
MRLRSDPRARLRVVLAEVDGRIARERAHATRTGATRATGASGATGAPGAPAPRSKAVAFRILFDEHLPRVRRHLSCFLDDRSEVEEIAADVFVVAWKKLQPENPMGITWLIRTADNKLRDAARRDRSKRRAIDALTRGLQETSDALHPLEALALREAIVTLSARERQVVVLTYWDELSAGEVAQVLRCSAAAVWTTLTRARAKLRRQLEAKEADA